MSVLYKALQKAEKENELRQSASSEAGFDTQRLAASGALKLAGRDQRGLINRVILPAVVVLVVGGGSAFFLLNEPTETAPAVPAVDVAQAPAPAATEPLMQPPPTVQATDAAAPALPETPTQQSAPPAPAEQTTPSADPAPSAPPTQTTAATPASVAPVPAAPAEPTQVSAETRVAAVPSAAERPQAKAPLPRPSAPVVIPTDSPARMLNPPIAINRAEFQLSGVGNQVQVREVSQAARSNVAAGYDALIRGSYDMALGFYDSALADEPNSVLGLLGRGAALQKLARGQEAQAAYEQVLKLDPNNREALTNMTSIVGDRSPQEALTRLLELEREYATFSPIKAQIGLSYAKLGSYPQALEYLRRALALTPGAVMYQYNLALVLDHMNRREQAATAYEQVLTSISAGRSSADLSAIDIERRVRFLRAR